MLRTVRTNALYALSLAATLACGAATARAAIDVKPFGKLPDGQDVEIYTLTNPSGASASIISYGATLTRVQMPDKKGKLGDVLLGYDTLEQYEKDSGPYFGATVGRVANRIAKGTFSVDGKVYHTAINNGPNTLHGGKAGYDKRLWKAEPIKPEAKGQQAYVKLDLIDPDGTEGFPGTVRVAVLYTLKDDNGLRIDFQAITDKPTPINLTNHSYWNLKDGGKSPVTDELMKWKADYYLPVDATQIPTGKPAPTAKTPFDFHDWKAIGKDLAVTPISDGKHGYDHNMIIDGAPWGQTREAVEVWDPTSGRTLTMLTTAPGVQFYSGNFLDGSIKSRGADYGQYHGFALEGENFPDAVNQPTFPNSILQPKQVFKLRTEYLFGVSETQPK
jgi:aldose 1-epimerase